MPPLGFTLVCLVGTTYSLDPSVLLAMLVSTSASRLGDEEFALEDRSKEEILHAIHQSQSKCLVFCDHHGAFQGDGSLSPHEKLILNSVIKKEGRANNICGSLHGKVLVALFKDEKNSYLGRVYVGSKNFTHALHEEFGLVAEFRETDTAKSDRFCTGLKDYLQYLKDFEAARVKVSDKLRPLEAAIGIMSGKKFKCALPGAEFHWQGRELDSKRKKSWTPLGEIVSIWVGKDSPECVYIHSPWARKRALDHLIKLCGEKTKFFLKCLDDRQLAIVDDKRVAYEFYCGSNGNLEPHHSHAKIYLFKKGRDALLAFGSANFTPDGWGLPGQNCRPNSEVLLTVRGPFTAFKELADIRGQKVISRGALPRQPDDMERALDYLSGIRADVEYDYQKNQLLYVFTLPDGLPNPVNHVEITHDLIEPHENGDRIYIWGGNHVPAVAIVPWDEKMLYLVAPVLRIREPETGAEVHVIVDLDLRFFNGRGQLKCLAYTREEFIQSLATLMEIPLSGTGPGVRHGSGDGNDVIRFLSALRLERYLYRLGRLKHHAPNEFQSALDRVARLLSMAPADHRLQASPFKEAREAILQCHQMLDEA